MIRLIIIALFLIIFFLLSIPTFLVEWIIGKFNPHAKAVSSLRIVQGTFRCILFLAGVKTTVIGLERIPKEEPVLFIGNHRSYFDIVIAYSRMPRLTGFVSKIELKKIPILRTWMNNLNCLFLDRSDMKAGMQMILDGIELIKNDVSVAIFPEGTRNKEDGVEPFKEGSFKFATKTKCKIVPFAQNNTATIFENQFPLIHKAHTVLEFGEPIDVTLLSKEELKAVGAYTHQRVAALYEKNKTLV